MYVRVSVSNHIFKTPLTDNTVKPCDPKIPFQCTCKRNCKLICVYGDVRGCSAKHSIKYTN